LIDLLSLPAATGIRRGLIPPLGSCAVYGMRLNDNGEIDATPDDPIRQQALGAGKQLTIEGPNGVKTLDSDRSNYEAALGGGLPGGEEAVPPVYLTPGTYTLRGGAEGEEVGPFTVTIELTPGVTWQNQAQISAVRRDQDLTLTWTGGDASKEFVLISGQSVNKDIGLGGSFVCAAPVEARQFTVPIRILRLLPRSSGWPGFSAGNPTGLLSVETGSWSARGRFSASGIDGGYFGYWNRLIRNVDYR